MLKNSSYSALVSSLCRFALSLLEDVLTESAFDSDDPLLRRFLLICLGGRPYKISASLLIKECMNDI